MDAALREAAREVGQGHASVQELRSRARLRRLEDISSEKILSGITEEEPLEEQPTQEASKDEEEQREKLPPKQPVKTVVTKKDLQIVKVRVNEEGVSLGEVEG